ncbi:threonine-phosphate decarboxylase CobD [Natranaerofaba carboxydovora]|uniref:threonine-phosphate decarboxylase CobD n=1 Tax=Natranaerofaba carboxydovora TaxID=2742683 RepID=UPI001F12BDD5|nr:threonine-phosphate decarboxylase CobD [Natranaerofaba carboxydovora]UMZ73147.1 Threonine-phosphate decarboxylase [Natranaerofaba carboxydovora]
MKPHEHGGQIYRWAKEFELDHEEIVDFSANINPLGPPENLKKELTKELDNLPNYPEPDALELCHDIANMHGISEENILVGNGASELIDLFFLYNKFQKAFFPAPTFKEYERACRSVGTEVENFYIYDRPLKDRLDDFIKKIKEKSPSVVVICTPNNPTGEVLEPVDIKRISDVVREINGWLFIDKSFITFVREDWPKLIWDNTIPDNTAIIYSFTKMYAIAGLRLGYIIGPSKMISEMKKLRNPWSVNHLAQVAGKVCLTEKEYEKKTRKLVDKERDRLIEGLEKLNFKTFPGKANYVLAKIQDNKNLNSCKLWEGLAKKGVLIRNAENFDGLDDSFFRIAVRLPEENEKLLKSLEDFLKTL